MGSPEELLKLGEELLSAPLKHANYAVELLGVVSNQSNTEEQRRAAMRALLIFFQDAIANNLVTFNPKKEKQEAKGVAIDTHRQWLARQFTAFHENLLQALSSANPPRLQITALTALMELCKGSKTLHTGLFTRVIDAIVSCKHTLDGILAVFTQTYIKYIDVRYFTFKAIQSTVERFTDREVDRSLFQVSGDDLVRNIYTILCCAPAIIQSNTKRLKTLSGSENKEESEMREEVESWCGAYEANTVKVSNRSEGANQRRKRRRQEADLGRLDSDIDKGNLDSKVDRPAKWITSKFQRRAFSEAWLSFLHLPVPRDVFRKVLIKTHEDVIPHMTNPLQLADLLSGALDLGGLEGMLALHAIFLLVTKYGLEYPAFYARLYQLFQPSIFLAKYRSRFFQLADIFLSSSLVPAYTVASFIKRFARLSLHAPPAGAMVCLAFIHNLLRRHPACLLLLNRESSSDTQPDAVLNSLANDTFQAAESDPAETHALESSLWEVKSLSSHYFNQVSTLALQIMDKDLSDRKKTAEVDIKPLTGGSFSGQAKSEMSRKIRHIPVAFYHTPLTSLLDSDSARCFPGWSF